MIKVKLKRIVMKKIIILAVGFLLLFEINLSAQTLEKHPDDKSVSRDLVLENGLKVLLVSDPKYNVSAASLEVQAGSLEDPKNRQGLAHFLEHMLFLGTEKFPDVEGFPVYLEKHGGYSNAYTMEDRTNYHIEVQHDAFKGALERFSRFFIDPLFSSEYIDKEINAVNSEHQKNLEQDAWRQFQLFRTFYRKDHPANHFSTGNAETLKGVTRDEFVSFYNRYYSANRMSLVLLSDKGLDELESMAREYFSPIKDNRLEPLTYDSHYLDSVQGVRIIRRDPVKDLRELALTFSIPDFVKYYSLKPDALIGFCIGHEGKGSLLSYLKARGLATGLGAGADYPTMNYGNFSIHIQLTQKGLENYRDVIRDCFSYIRLLKEQGIPEYVFKEIKHMAELDFTYSNKGEGAQRAAHLAENLTNYPAEMAESVDYIYDKFDPEVVESLISYLRPDNMLCMLTAEGFKTDKVEPYYKTGFSYNVEKGDFYASLLNPPMITGLSLPASNTFVPDDVTLLAGRPVNLISEPGLDLWYAQDTEFNMPKVSLRFRIRNQKDRVDAGYMTRLYLYADCINEELNEIAYPAGVAGLGYEFSADPEGLTIVINGYAPSVGKLLNEIGKRLKTLNISEEKFAAIKDIRMRGWKNFKMGEAWDVAREISRTIRKKTYFSPDDYLKEGGGLGLADLKKFVETLYDKTRIEGLVYGDITSEQAISLSRGLQSCIPSLPLNKEDTFKQGILVEKAKDPLTYIERLETNNSCLWRSVYLGSETPGLRMTARILDKFISPLFYAEMRTRQQLGYIVWAVAPEDNGQYYLFFVTQSESHPADLIRQKAEAFLSTLPARFAALSDEEFAEYKAAVREELLEKPKSIDEKRILLQALTFDYERDFDRLQESLDALEGLSRPQVAQLLTDILNPETRRITDILLFAKQHTIMNETKASFDSVESFKKGRAFVERTERSK